MINEVKTVNMVKAINTINTINAVKMVKVVNMVNTVKMVNTVNTVNSVKMVNTVKAVNTVNTVNTVRRSYVFMGEAHRDKEGFVANPAQCLFRVSWPHPREEGRFAERQEGTLNSPVLSFSKNPRPWQ